MAADIGKIFETEIAKVFRLLATSHLLGWHRLTDTGAAGNVVGAQPSDYLLGLPTGSDSPLDGQRLMFMEVKASEKHHSLGKAMMKPGQRGAINYFRYLLNIPYLVLFWDTQLGVLQLWDGVAIQGEKNIDKKHILASWEDIGTCHRLKTQQVADKIADHFKLPPASATLANMR